MSFKLLSGEELTKAIIAVNKASHKLGADVQNILLSCTYYALKDGSVTELNALWLGIGKGAVRRDAIKNWAAAFGPFLVNDNKKTMAEKPFVFSRERADELLKGDSKSATAEQVEAHISGITATWTDYKEPPMVPESWDVAAMLRKVLTEAKKLGGKNTKIINGELLSKIEGILPPAPDAVQSV